MNEQTSEPEDAQVVERKEGQLVEETNDIPCKYCADPDPKRVSHLVCIETVDDEGESHVHVHAPFENRLAMYRMLNAIEEEIVKHKRGDVKKQAKDLL